MLEVVSEDEEYLQTADLDDPGWPEELVPDSHEYLCIHEIPRLATPPSQPSQGLQATPSPQPHQGVSETQLPQPNQGVPATSSPQPDQNRETPGPYGPGGHTRLITCARIGDITFEA